MELNAESTDLLLKAEGVVSNNGTKGNPCLSGDILGDWREEVIWPPKTRRNYVFILLPYRLWTDRHMDE